MLSQVDQELISKIALNHIPGVGDAISKILISYCGSATEVFRANKGKLLKIPGIGEVLAQAILSNQALDKAEKEYANAIKNNVKIVSQEHPEYPENLKQIADAPNIIYLKGVIHNHTTKMIAIVGTRNATNYGKKICLEIHSKIAELNLPITIVSGLAYGIDIAAHQACLQYNIPTIAVMANGMDKIYPAVHKDIAQRIVGNNGALLTEYPFGSKAEAHHFPSRNRIVAGMCEATIVVEAAAKGGALITADLALGYDREVFAVPGNLGSKYSEGNNNLIRENKAQIFTSIEAFVEALNWSIGSQGTIQENTAKVFNFDHLKPDSVLVLKHLSKQESGCLIDDMSWQLGIPINKMASILLELEFEGYIKALPGKKFIMA
jgi:DNA processing protein